MNVLELRKKIECLNTDIDDCKASVASFTDVVRPELFKEPAEYIAYYMQHRSDVTLMWFAPLFTRLCMQIDNMRMLTYRNANTEVAKYNVRLADLVAERSDLIAKYNALIDEQRAIASADYISE